MSRWSTNQITERKPERLLLRLMRKICAMQSTLQDREDRTQNPLDHEKTRERYSQDLTRISSNKFNHFPKTEQHWRTCAARFLPLLLFSGNAGLTKPNYFPQLKWRYYIHVRAHGEKMWIPREFLNAVCPAAEALCGRHDGRLSEWAAERDGISPNRVESRIFSRWFLLRQWRRCCTSTFWHEPGTLGRNNSTI